MRRSKTNKPSSSTFKLQAATPRPQARTSRPSRAFSLLQYPFAIPLGLRNLLRLAAVMVLLAQVPVQILNDARKPVFKSTLFEKSATSGIYDEMVTAQVANAISRSGEFGLVRSLAIQLKPGESSATSNSIPSSDSPSS